MKENHTSKRILEHLRHGDYRERREAVLFLKQSPDPDTWTAVLENIVDFSASFRTILIETLIPHIRSGKAMWAAYFSHSLLTRILPEMRSDELELSVLDAICSNKSIGMETRSRILCEGLVYNFFQNRPQRRLTRRLLVALYTSPIPQSYEVVWNLLPHAREDFKGDLIDYMTTHRSELSRMIALTNQDSISNEQKSRIFQAYLKTFTGSTWWERRGITKVILSSKNKELFLEQMLLCPSDYTTLLALDIMKHRDKISLAAQYIVVNSIKYESNFKRLRTWWELSQQVTNRHLRIKMVSKIIWRLNVLTTAESYEKFVLDQNFAEIQTTFGKGLNLRTLSGEIQDESEVMNKLWRIERTLDSGTTSFSWKNDILPLYMDIPDQFKAAAMKIITRFLAGRTEVCIDFLNDFFFEKSAAASDLTSAVVAQIHVSQMASAWNLWARILLDWNRRWEQPLSHVNKLLTSCFEHGIARLKSGAKQTVLSEEALFLCFELAQHLGQKLPFDAISVFLKGRRHNEYLQRILLQASDSEFEAFTDTVEFQTNPQASEILIENLALVCKDSGQESKGTLHES